MTHEEKMAELKAIQALMSSNPAEALRRMKEGKYLPEKKSPTK